MDGRPARLAALRERLVDGLAATIPDCRLTGSRSTRLPHHASFVLRGAKADGVLLDLDLCGVAASSGSACAQRTGTPSHVLRAIGCAPQEMEGSLCFTLGRWSTLAEVDAVLDRLPPIVARLRALALPAWFFVSGIDVRASTETGGVVALGDSLTDANISTHDAYCRWPDQLARRLIARRGSRSLGVMNQGLGGNRILHDVRGDSGLRRFDRDVLAQPGVTHAIVMLGTNDLRNRYAKPDEEVTAEQMIPGLNQMVLRAQARGIKLFGATLTPFGNETFLPGAWNPVREGHRVRVNTWIRESGALDGVVDFDTALRDPERPTQMLPIYDCGDGLHPSDLGYCTMGDAIDLALFD